MHTLIDFDGNLPANVNITDGKTADNKGAYEIPLLRGSVVLAVRFYNDFPLLNIWESKGIFFVVRHKENLQYVSIKENELPENLQQHILKDEIIELKSEISKTKYSNKLRRISIWNDEKIQFIELITNQFTWSPNTISELYKSRWQVEIFFRDLKQLLHIKTFTGTSENAVMTQIWTALITLLILKALKAQSQYGWHLSNLVAFNRLNLFVKIDLLKCLSKQFKEHLEPPPEYK